MSSIFDDPVEIQGEPLVMIARRSLPAAQERMAGAALRTAASAATVGWFGADAYPETAPALALVRDGGPLEDLVGEVVRVTRIWPGGLAAVYSYVDAAVSLEPDVDLSLSRRAFLSLALLSQETLSCQVEVIA